MIQWIRDSVILVEILTYFKSMCHAAGDAYDLDRFSEPLNLYMKICCLQFIIP